jgi:methylase of polypeptide subunit release factors
MRSTRDIEADRLREQFRLDGATSPEQRNRAGQFATPAPLAEEIVRYCLERWQTHPKPVRFLEPCIGTGSFYSALRRVFPAHLLAMATGYEIDPAYADVARYLWQGAGLTVKAADFTKEPPPHTKYNLLITNPPYVRHHHLDRSQKERLRTLVKDRLGITLSGLAGLYCYFLLIADAWLAESGLSVWLIPSEFLDVNYGTAVKQYLTQRVKLLHIHCFCPSDTQFDDALVSSAIVIFEKAPPSGHAVTFSLGGSLLNPDRVITLDHAVITPAAKWTRYHTADGQSPGSASGVGTFGDLFTIRRGLATGNNDFFILPRDQARRLELPEACLRPILPAPRLLQETVIEADADGYPRLDRQLALIDCSLPEHLVQNRFPTLWRYLQEGHHRHIHESYLTSRRTPWYAQEHRPPPPFLCTYMGRNGRGRKPFRFIWNKSQATAHNVYLLLYPKGLLQERLEHNRSLYGRVFSTLRAFDTNTLTGGGRVYGGGLFKMEPRELASISADFLLKALALDLPRKPSRDKGLFDYLDSPSATD